MGQYYRGAIVNRISKRTKRIKVKMAFDCYTHHNGAKLMEHSYVGNYYMKQYEHALATVFYNSPLVWVGDYADEKLDTNVYDSACNFIEKREKRGLDKNLKTLNELPNYKYAINFTKKMFVRIDITETENGDYPIHPLSLLCSDGNGRGGGDYEGSNMELIGSWAYDRIGVSNELPKSIKKELQVTFKETYYGGDSDINDYKIVKRTE